METAETKSAGMEFASFFLFFFPSKEGLVHLTVKAPPTRGLCLYGFGGCLTPCMPQSSDGLSRTSLSLLV